MLQKAAAEAHNNWITSRVVCFGKFLCVALIFWGYQHLDDFLRGKFLFLRTTHMLTIVKAKKELIGQALV